MPEDSLTSLDAIRMERCLELAREAAARDEVAPGAKTTHEDSFPPSPARNLKGLGYGEGG